jgi:hypothetical protein
MNDMNKEEESRYVSQETIANGRENKLKLYWNMKAINYMYAMYCSVIY